MMCRQYNSFLSKILINYITDTIRRDIKVMFIKTGNRIIYKDMCSLLSYPILNIK